MSRRDPTGSLIATGKWPQGYHERGRDLLRMVLKGVGDPERERIFRMNVTLCMHRAATEEEVAGLPSSWHKALSGMAGGPVEVLWTSGNVMDAASARPCRQPGHRLLDPRRPDLWIPDDCGTCDSCIARRALRVGAPA